MVFAIIKNSETSFPLNVWISDDLFRNINVKYQNFYAAE